MLSRHRGIVHSGLFALVALGLSALSSVADETGENVVAEAKPAWLGILTAPLPPLVSEHVGLEKGQGTLVEAVVAGSPAEHGGLLKRDIITHVDGEVLAGVKALRRLIISKVSGDTLLLNIRRDHKSVQARIKLADRPRRMALSGRRPEKSVLRVIPLENEINDAMEPFDRGVSQKIETLVEREQQMATSSEQTMSQRVQVSVDDASGKVEVLIVDGVTTAKVWDAEGKVIFDGPYQTDEDMAAAPEEARERINAVKSSNATLMWIFSGFSHATEEEK